jgi:peptide/nickel transport system permease protein
LIARFLRRVGWSLGVVWAVVSLTFVLDAVVPGDPARMVAGPQASAADVAHIRRTLGLDRPPAQRYVAFWRHLVHLGPNVRDRDPESRHATCAIALPLGPASVHVDLGKSFQLRQPVVEVIAPRFLRTMTLASAALFVQLAMGVLTGTLAAARKDTWVDRLLVTGGLVGLSAPTFLIALVLQYVLAYRLRWLPFDGFGTSPLDHARCIVLPAVTLGIYGGAYYTRLVRDEVASLLTAPWVKTARAKGAGSGTVLVVHALRNGLLPIATLAGLDFGSLLGGAIVTETVFRWPGLGELSVRATLNRDGPVIAACVIVTSVAVVGANLVADIAYTRLDPRVRGPLSGLPGRGSR